MAHTGRLHQTTGVILKGAIWFVIIVAASAVGVFVGNAWQNETPRLPISAQNSNNVFEKSDQLYLVEGDLFPPLDATPPSGEVVKLDSLLEGRPSVLLMWSLGCDGCYKEAALWNSSLRPHLRSAVATYVCLDHQYRNDTLRLSELAGDQQVLFLDFEDLRVRINLVMAPQIIVLDEQRFVMHVDYGYHDGFDRDLVEYVVADL